MYALTRSKAKPAVKKQRYNSNDDDDESFQVMTPNPPYAFYPLRAESPSPKIASTSAAPFTTACYYERLKGVGGDAASLPATSNHTLTFNNNNNNVLPPTPPRNDTNDKKFMLPPTPPRNGEAAIIRKQRLQKEMQRLDRKLRDLDMKVASRKNRISLQSSNGSIMASSKGGLSRLLSPQPSGESSTMAMTTNSDDATEWKDLLEKEIIVPRHTDLNIDEDSVSSDVTTPLTPQEELDRFIHLEIGILDEDEASCSIRTTATTMRSSVLWETTSSVSNVVERQSSSTPLHYHSLHTRHVMKKQQQHHRHDHHDTGDAQPGRVKNMPWLLTFADDRPPISTLYTGPLRGGVPHGVGTFRFRSNGDMLYMGEIKQGRMNGFGMSRTSTAVTTSTTATTTTSCSCSGGSSHGDKSGSRHRKRRRLKIRRGEFVNNVFQQEHGDDTTTKVPNESKVSL